MRVVWTVRALGGIAIAYEYIFGFNPRAAMQVAQGLLDAADSLANFPHRGRPVGKTGMRELVTSYPYVIRYRVTGDRVVIPRVRHTSRRPTNP